MKNSTYKNLLNNFKSKGILAISGGLILVSCGAQMGGYTETDGVYYDPNKDVIPEGIAMTGPEENVIDEPYTYENDSVSIIEQNQINQMAQQNKYKNWNKNQKQSDWGSYAGTEQNYYYNNWGASYYPYYGWGNSWSIGFSWGSPYYGYNPYYWDAYWGGGYYPNYYGYGYYNPWYYSYYNPYYYSPYYGYYGGYNPYHYGGYYYYTRPYNYKRSGADSINRGNNGFQTSTSNGRGFNRLAPNSNTNPTTPSTNSNGFRRSGFGNPNPNQSPNVNPAPVTPNNNYTPSSNRGFRRTSEYAPSQQPSYSPPRNDNFRSSGSSSFGGGSSNSGGGRSSGGGGFRGGFR